MKLFATLLILFSAFSAFGVTIDFPEEELATESVLPLFDNPEAVKSRLVPTEGRWELGFDGGFAMNEPFFKTIRYGAHLGYHIDETHGLTFVAQLYQQGLNNNGEAIYKPEDNIDIRMDFAPQNQYNVFLNYQITPYYGKISVTKGMVMNLSLYGYAGLGAVGIGSTNTENSLAMNLGFGQKFYMSKNWGFRADLGLVVYQGPNYIQADTPLLDNPDDSGDDIQGEVSPSRFEKITNFDLQLSFSFIFLI